MTVRNNAGVISLPVDRLHIEVTNHCNFSCEFCPDSKMERKRGFMDLEMLKGILDEVAEKGIARLVLFHVMGEPLIYPELFEAIRYAKDRKIKTCITTNGSLLTEEALEKMIQAGISSIILSLQTPDEDSFKFRGARNLRYDEYSDRIKKIARRVICGREIQLVISFLSSPLRRLIFPVMPELSIADTAGDLKKKLLQWSIDILEGTPFEDNLKTIRKKLRWVGSFKENSIDICPNLTFKTRIMGDWAVHSFKNGVKAKIGFCPGLQENFGILWNGDIVFCCVDFDGKTVAGTIKEISLMDYLNQPQIQEVVKGFNRFHVVHTHCQRCMGDKKPLNAIVRQLGSIAYFKGYRKVFSGNPLKDLNSQST